MNVVLIGKEDKVSHISHFLNKEYDMIRIDGNLVLKQENIITTKGSNNYGLFETVFNKLMDKHLDKMAVKEIKTGFVFNNYPVNDFQYSSLEDKMKSVNSNIDIVIQLDEYINPNTNSKTKWVNIQTDNMNKKELENKVIKKITRTAMKKIINT